jgi:hypothetical protein
MSCLLAFLKFLGPATLEYQPCQQSAHLKILSPHPNEDLALVFDPWTVRSFHIMLHFNIAPSLFLAGLAVANNGHGFTMSAQVKAIDTPPAQSSSTAPTGTAASLGGQVSSLAHLPQRDGDDWEGVAGTAIGALNTLLSWILGPDEPMTITTVVSTAPWETVTTTAPGETVTTTAPGETVTTTAPGETVTTTIISESEEPTTSTSTVKITTTLTTVLTSDKAQTETQTVRVAQHTAGGHYFQHPDGSLGVTPGHDPL